MLSLSLPTTLLKLMQTMTMTKQGPSRNLTLYQINRNPDSNQYVNNVANGVMKNLTVMPLFVQFLVAKFANGQRSLKHYANTMTYHQPNVNDFKETRSLTSKNRVRIQKIQIDPDVYSNPHSDPSHTTSLETLRDRWGIVTISPCWLHTPLWVSSLFTCAWCTMSIFSSSRFTCMVSFKKPCIPHAYNTCIIVYIFDQ